MSAAGSKRILILSRKDLGPVTRVPRQADALAQAGHRVTVVSLKRPSEGMIGAASGVTYIEVEIDFWTRRRLVAIRQARKRRSAAQLYDVKARDTRRPSSRRLTRTKALRWLRDRAPSLIAALPTAALLSTPEDNVRERVKQLASSDLPTVLGLYAQAVSQLVASHSFANKASEALLGQRFDVVQAHDNYALVAAQRLADEKDARLIYDAVEISEHRISVRESPLNKLVDRYQRWSEARIFRQADEIITVGDGLADWYAERYGLDRPLPIRNCRWFWPYHPREQVRRDCRLESGDKLVMWFGYGYPAQGLETVVEAAARTPKNVHFALAAAVLPKWESFMAGLKERVTELQLEGRVHFLEPQTPESLVSYASGADIGIIPRPNVSPNIYYSMPNKLMEMVMARLPVGVADLVDMRALVERYDIGRVFNVEDAEDVARKLVEMLEPELHGHLRERVMSAAEVLCWERESRRYVGLFGPAAAGTSLVDTGTTLAASSRG